MCPQGKEWKGERGGRCFNIYICGSLNVARKKVGMESVVFAVIHTTSVEYNNKVTVLWAGENCAWKIKLFGIL